jgi:hypothetical protein
VKRRKKTVLRSNNGETLMNIHSFPRLAGMALAFVSSTVLADQVSEVEVNHPVAAAQYLVMPADPVTVNARLGDGLPSDVDYFTFRGQAGDVVTLDIDRAASGTQYMDSVLAIFGPAPGYSLLRMNDDAWPLDPGSTSALDSRIERFVLPQTGQYTVGVSNFPRYFLAGGGVRAGSLQQGSYQLVISGVTPEIKQIAIDIKPGSSDVAPINPKSRGKVPVALLSGPDFDPATVDVESLTFGSTGNEPSLEKCAQTGEDLNLDGIADVVCHFANQAANFKPGDMEGILRGTAGGLGIEGRGFLKIVPEKAPQY